MMQDRRVAVILQLNVLYESNETLCLCVPLAVDEDVFPNAANESK